MQVFPNGKKFKVGIDTGRDTVTKEILIYFIDDSTVAHDANGSKYYNFVEIKEPVLRDRTPLEIMTYLSKLDKSMDSATVVVREYDDGEDEGEIIEWQMCCYYAHCDYEDIDYEYGILDYETSEVDNKGIIPKIEVIK